MPLITVRDGEATILTPEPYSTESELEEVLQQNPALLVGQDEPPLAFVASQYHIGGAGRADLFHVDGEGLPVLVEVKLARNPQSRREVIAQVFDYAASLAERTVDEVDSDVSGAVERALREFSEDEEQFKVRWQALGANLRAGSLRIIVAVDMESEDLSRVIGFINDHSDLDVRLIVIEKYRDPGGVCVYSSTATITANSAGTPTPRSKKRRQPRPEFQAVLDAWEDLERAPLSLRGRAAGYRQLKPEGWPNGLHYEFLDSSRIGIEIHLESGAVKVLAPLLRELAKELAAAFPTAECSFDPKWSRSRGRLRVMHAEGTDPAVLAGNMKGLIEKTQERLSRALQGGGRSMMQSDGGGSGGGP